MSNDEHKQRPRSRKELAAWYALSLEDQASSGLSISAYAAKIGVTAATLYQWRRRLGAQAGSAGETRAGGPSGLIQVAVKNPSPARTPEKFVVRLRSDHRVEVPQNFDPAALEQLLGILETC